MNRSEQLEGGVEGILQNRGRLLCLSGLNLEGSDSPLSRDNLSRVCISGSAASRRRMTMEIVLREAEAGECHAIIDLNGAYSPIIDYVPSLRIYKLGRYACVNPFRPLGEAGGSAEIISMLFQSLYDLSRDERIYLEKGLGMVYEDKLQQPSVDDIIDRLLQVQSDVQPKEAYKVECLKNVLWEIESNPIGAMLYCREQELRFPAVLDLSALGSLRERALVASCLMLRAACWGISCLVLDPADRALPADHTSNVNLQRAFEECLDSISKKGIMLHLGATSTSSLPRGIAEAASAQLLCGPIWEKGFNFVERSYSLTRESSMNLRQLCEGSALMCVYGKGEPRFLRPSPSAFRDITDHDVFEHMQTLGEEQVECRGHVQTVRMLEKVFRDRAARTYAWEVLRLVRGGRVPVDAVVHQKNVLLKAVVKTLKRYFMVVEYTDSAGMGWYRLTKVGERAVSEMEVHEGDNAKSDGKKGCGDEKEGEIGG